MGLHVPPLVTKVELEIAALPEKGETVQELVDRLQVAGYTIIRIESDRVVLVNEVEES